MYTRNPPAHTTHSRSHEDHCESTIDVMSKNRCGHWGRIDDMKSGIAGADNEEKEADACQKKRGQGGGSRDL